MPQQVSSARLWCWNGIKLDYQRAYPLIAIASELHTNALRHTASGSMCGRVRMEMEAYRGMFWIAVTDEGVLPGREPTVPELGAGFGLRLVDRLATGWGWFGRPGGPITVWAVVDPRDGTPPAAAPELAIPAQRATG